MQAHKRKSVGGSVEFMCERGNCGKTFCSNSDLLKHHNLHDNILDKCPFCPWGSPVGQTHLISIHLNQHLNLTNFECSVCKKRFFRKVSLDDHFEIYHEKVEGKYRCKICVYKTYSRLSLGQHMLKNHK